MKLLLSINDRNLENISIERLFELIKIYDENKLIYGIEFCSKSRENQIKMAKKCKLNNKYLQFHSPYLENDINVNDYLSILNDVSKILGYKVKVVFHSINLDNEDLDESIKMTNEYINKIINYYKENNYNILVSIENLNKLNNKKRININLIDNILNTNNELHFTYDIGHDIYDNKEITKLNDLELKRIVNIHIHNIKDNVDHYPLYKEDKCYLKTKQEINNLINNNFDNTIVLEYAIDYIEGNLFEEKVIEYIKIFENISK